MEWKRSNNTTVGKSIRRRREKEPVISLPSINVSFSYTTLRNRSGGLSDHKASGGGNCGEDCDRAALVPPLRNIFGQGQSCDSISRWLASQESAGIRLLAQQ